jgi:hypothetical protein
MFIGDPETGISDTSLPSCLPCAPTIGTNGACAHYDHASIQSAYDSSSLVSCSILTHAATWNDSCNHDQFPESHYRCHDPAPPKRLPAPPSSSYATPPAFHLADTAGEPPVRIHSPVQILRPICDGLPPALSHLLHVSQKRQSGHAIPVGMFFSREKQGADRLLDADVGISMPMLGLGTQGKWYGSVKECKGTWVT